MLIADDQPDVLRALRLLFKGEGIACVAVSTPEQALERLRAEAFDAALIDLNYRRDTTSGAEGLELLAALRKLDAELPVVVMTAWGSIDIAVQAMQVGAADFIEKPWDNRRLINVLDAQLKLARSRRREQRLDAENRLLRGDDGEPFIAQAPSMQPVLELLRRVAPSDANVLILGENGAGKGVLARQLHRWSRRRAQTMISVNMGGIAASVFESEMFGHTRGAFTDAKSDRIGRFELADGGTLFLDEIANIPAEQQPKLLRVLEDGELERLGSSRTIKLDVRVVSATNAELPTEVAAGRFRKDLLYRLNTVEIHLPPLRERREDIAAMTNDLLARFAKRYQRDRLRLAPSALRALEHWHWPGNVRELAHVVERAVLMASSSLIEQVDVAPTSGSTAMLAVTTSGGALNLEKSEQSLIRQGLAQCEGNVQRTAKLLGLSRGALYRRLEKYGLGV
ncbi:MAG: sigma-54-dependent Fis family transcriptional regulator [Lysobacterales bacterium CG02_land_8_20_14_3_00_62_12]|nr:MAG: sigma-54-dependent Fis family transcriptional regulator [Xanthomonadales bacterium CG02_land_8_20_14_3_00_62_12]